MGFENHVKESFGRVKEDVEGVKNELAFALKRIAKIEELLNRQAIEQISKSRAKKKKSSQKVKRKIIEY